ncbi:MAG: 3-hydroxybutyryl-CoA dehydrogenase [Vampirovibrionales bacterium]|nr:3-hydroxybutyryl-CoA dehydrogenase [Vampirovibrionales bacterium]
MSKPGVLSITNAVAQEIRNIQTVAVIGSGQMGAGIAQVMAQAGKLEVIVQDVNEGALEKARNGIEKSLEKLASKQIISAETPKEALARLSFTPDLSAIASADLVVEAIVEDEAIKKSLFSQLDSLLKPTAIIASNTSSISITRLASATKRAEQVIGMHFMNPVPLMQLVELIRGAQTSDETYDTIAQLSKSLGKTPVVSRDFPGFISNRVLMPLLNEAMFALYEGVASAEDIDTVMKLGMNHPMGPLTLADFIGLDTCLSIMNVLYDGFKDPRFRPCPLLKQYVDAGYYGKKSGRGFFIHEK